MSTNNDMEFHNWVKACLAIKCVRNGIIPLLEKHCKEHYSNNTDQVLNVCGLPKYSCNQCDVTKLEPYHKHSRTKCGYRKCACKEKNMNMKPCTENLACGVIYDQIKAAHINNDPSWSNTNCDKWSSSAWEQMKCYISTPGYKEKADISCADLTALIQICLNYIPLRTLFNQNIIDLDEVRRCRNDIYHSSTMELANDRLNYFLSTMKTFLKLRFFQDFKAEVDCQLEQLSKLEKDEFEVSIENEIAARKDALDGIQESMADMQRSFSQMKDQLEEINKRTADQCSENREIKQHLSAQTKNINSIQETQASISESMSDLHTNIRESSEKTDSRYGEILASNALIRANQCEILARIDQLNKSFQTQNPDAEETLKTDIVTKINVKPTNAEAGNTVSEELCTAGNEILNGFNGDSADDQLKQRLTDVVEQLQEGNNTVTAFKQKCVEIYILSPTVQSWVTLNKAFFNGTIEKAFLPVQTYLRTRHGCGNLTLTIELDQDCFNKCANTIIINLDRMFNNQQTEDHPYKVTENERKEETHETALKGNCGELKNDTVTQTPVVNMKLPTLWDEIQPNVSMPVIKSFEETRDMDEGVQIKVTILKNLQRKLQTFRRVTAELAASLEEVARVYNKARLATIAGSAAGVVGGAMGAIGGLILAPFTAAVSLLVSAAGAGVGALVGITVGGAAIGESVERKNAVKKAQEIVKKFEQERNYLIIDCKHITDLLGADNLDKDFPLWASFITKLIIGSSTIAWSVALRELNGIVSGIRLGKAISELSLEAVMAGGGVATSALGAGSVAARGLHVVGAAVGIILIPIDLGCLVHSAHAVSTDKVSDTAKKISVMAEMLRAFCPSEGEIDDAVFKTIEKLINQ